MEPCVKSVCACVSYRDGLHALGGGLVVGEVAVRVDAVLLPS